MSRGLLLKRDSCRFLVSSILLFWVAHCLLYIDAHEQHHGVIVTSNVNAVACPRLQLFYDNLMVGDIVHFFTSSVYPHFVPIYIRNLVKCQAQSSSFVDFPSIVSFDPEECLN